jgi:hypothetical protein
MLNQNHLRLCLVPRIGAVMKKLLFVLVLWPTLAFSQTLGSPGSGSGSSGGGNTPATSNITEYVATTGSDTNNNCQTSGSPCATIQRALTEASLYNYQGLYTLAISASDGTYTSSATSPVTVPSLVNYPANKRPALTGDTATPANAVIQSANSDALNTASYAVWQVEGFRLKSTSCANNDFNIGNSSVLTIGYIDFAGCGTLMSVNTGSYVDTGAPGQTSGGLPLTSSTSSAKVAISVFLHSSFVTDGSIWTFNNSPAFSSEVINIADHALLGSGTYSGTVTGNKLYAFNFVVIEFDRSNLPGNGSITEQGLITYAGAEFLWATALGVYGIDCNISNANSCTVPSFNVQSSAATGTGITLANSSSGGHSYSIYSAGSSTGAPEWYVFDNTANGIPFQFNMSFAAIPSVSEFAFTSDSAGEGSFDTAISRDSAGVFDFGNGTVGNSSGIIKAAVSQAGGAVPTGTTGSCSTGTITGGKSAGKFTAPLCAAGTYILSALPTMANGYECDAQDQTTPADTLKQTANSVTSVTFTATTALNDVVVFKCMGF